MSSALADSRPRAGARAPEDDEARAASSLVAAHLFALLLALASGVMLEHSIDDGRWGTLAAACLVATAAVLLLARRAYRRAAAAAARRRGMARPAAAAEGRRRLEALTAHRRASGG